MSVGGRLFIKLNRTKRRRSWTGVKGKEHLRITTKIGERDCWVSNSEPNTFLFYDFMDAASQLTKISPSNWIVSTGKSPITSKKIREIGFE